MSSDIIKRPVKTLRVTTQKQDCNKCLAVIWTKNFAFVITNLLDTPCPKPPQCLKFYIKDDNLQFHVLNRLKNCGGKEVANRSSC